MKIVIDISDDTYKAVCNGCMLPPDVENVVNAIKNGKPLPERHGDLIDRNSLELDSDWSDYYDGFSAYSESQVRLAPAIIEGSDSEMNKCTKKNCPMNAETLNPDCNLKDCPYRTEIEDKGEISDGYHTFNQLYHQRAVLFACIVRQNKNKAWKSFKHSDGKYCFDSNGEWFIVGVDTPQGSYTYHYAKEYWDMFDCQELECGKEWDGHTEEDVTRLLSLPYIESEE